jgi:hypothetical protein
MEQKEVFEWLDQNHFLIDIPPDGTYEKERVSIKNGSGKLIQILVLEDQE